MKSFLLVAILFSACANAGWLVQDGVVEYVENTSGNNDVFTAFVSGGTGPCSSMLITFPRASAGNQDVFDRAFAIVTAAQVSGRKVSVYNYVDQGCGNAVGVRLLK